MSDLFDKDKLIVISYLPEKTTGETIYSGHVYIEAMKILCCDNVNFCWWLNENIIMSIVIDNFSWSFTCKEIKNCWV